MSVTKKSLPLHLRKFLIIFRKMKRIIIVFLTLLYSISGFSNELNNEQKSIKLNIMTYNVHHCNPPAIKGLIDIDAIANVIKSNSIEIAFLQEIDVRTTRVNGIDQALELSQKTGLKYFRFFKAIDIMGGEYGVMILSKYPIDSTMVYPLYQEGDSEQRVLGIANVILPDNFKLKVACTHLDLSARLREVEINEIDSILSRESIPVILGGDFNATSQSNEIKLMGEKYVSSTKEFLSTFPNKNPNRTIDYIFISKSANLRVLSHKVLVNTDASDHLPVVAEIECLK